MLPQFPEVGAFDPPGLSVPKGFRPVSDALLPRIAAGNQGAVRECLDRYGPLVWSLARRFLGNVSDAEDAVQEIFLDLWKNAARYDSRLGEEVTFVATLARRRLIDRRRSGQRRPDFFPLPEALPARTDSDSGRLETREQAALAAEAVAELRDEQRRALHMAIFQGLTHEEIARATGWPLGTVKTHVRRGLLRVREVLDAQSPRSTALPLLPGPETTAESRRVHS